MNRTLLPLAALTLLLSACAGPRAPDAAPLPPPPVHAMGPGPVIGISAPQYCPGAPLRMIYYPFTDAERVKLAAHADCLKRHPRLQVGLRGPAAAQDAARRELGMAGVAAQQLQLSPAVPGSGQQALEVVYPQTLPD